MKLRANSPAEVKDFGHERRMRHGITKNCEISLKQCVERVGSGCMAVPDGRAMTRLARTGSIRHSDELDFVDASLRRNHLTEMQDHAKGNQNAENSPLPAPMRWTIRGRLYAIILMHRARLPSILTRTRTNISEDGTQYSGQGTRSEIMALLSLLPPGRHLSTSQRRCFPAEDFNLINHALKRCAGQARALHGLIAPLAALWRVQSDPGLRRGYDRCVPPAWAPPSDSQLSFPADWPFDCRPSLPSALP